jgi:3-oxoacyl-[acyl-carrier protein] reductase
MTDESWNMGMVLKLTTHVRDNPSMGRPQKVKRAIVFISGNAAVLPKAGAPAVGAINAAIEALA